MSDPRFRTVTARLLRVLLAAPAAPRYGTELMATAEISSRVLYPMLAQLERARWIESGWEPADPFARRPRPRRYYRLTPEGVETARAAIAAVRAAPAPPPDRSTGSSPGRRPSVLLTLVPLAVLLIARLRTPSGLGPALFREWRAELDDLVRSGASSAGHRLARCLEYAAGLFGAAGQVGRDLGPCRTLVPVDPLLPGGARHRLRIAERARDAAARRHQSIDPELDPLGEALALHVALCCQVETDEAQLAYRAACAIAELEQQAPTR